MKRTLIITAVVIAILGLVGGIAYAFGTPQAPVAAPVALAPAGQDLTEAGTIVSTPQAPEQASGAGGGSMADVPKPAPGTKAPAADPKAPLAIQIPGCVCHSDDPKVVEEHSGYRMNQCAGCHGGETPTGR